MQMSPNLWDVAARIGTPLALAAFALAAGLFVARSYFAKRRKEIEAATPEQRVEMLMRLEDAFVVPVNKLSAEKKFDLAMEILRNREKRSRTRAQFSMFVAALLTIVVLVAMLVRPDPQPAPQAERTAPGKTKPTSEKQVEAEPTREPSRQAARSETSQPNSTRSAAAVPSSATSSVFENPSHRGAVRRRAEPAWPAENGTPTPSTALNAETSIGGNVRASDHAKQNVGVIQGPPGVGAHSETRITGDVTATDEAEQRVGGVKN